MNILVPRNIEGRKKKLHQDTIKLLSQDVIKGSLTIDESFEDIPLELIKVKEIKGNVSLYLNYIPSWLIDIKIEGFFDCSGCNLTSLKNCPKHIDRSLYCYGNKLKSLKHCPIFIGHNVICHDNLKKLKRPKNSIIKGFFFNQKTKGSSLYEK